MTCCKKTNCLDIYGCNGECPDLSIRRYDNKPFFKVKVEDCDGPLDLTDLVLETTMWAKAKLKVALEVDTVSLSFADNIGFPQVMIGDILLMKKARLPEKMLVIGFDEENNLVLVERGYQNTTAQNWKKGSALKILKFIDVASKTEMILQDITQMDGTVLEDQLIESYFIYEWGPNDTCLSGCYLLEFKLMKMSDDLGPVSTDYGCGLPVGVQYIQRYPTDSEGFKIKINESSISEV